LALHALHWHYIMPAGPHNIECLVQGMVQNPDNMIGLLRLSPYYGYMYQPGMKLTVS